MFRSLQSRLTASFVLVLVATVVALGASIAALFAQSLQTEYATAYRNDEQRIYALMQQTVQGQVFQSQFLAGRLGYVAALLSDQFLVRVRVYSNPGGVLWYDARPSGIDAAKHLAVDHLPAYRFVLRNDPVTLATVVVSDPYTDRAYVLQQFYGTVIWIVVAASLAAFAIGGIASERLTAPFRILSRAARRMGDGNLDERVPEGRRDEAGELARQFNLMAARLQESFSALSSERDRLRQFVAEVSHELRTPLTALRTFNDVLRDGAAEDPATRREFLDDSARQIERLDWLTHNLLDLSRLDAGITRLALQPADLGETLRRAVESVRPAAAARDVTIDLSARPLYVPHDPPRVQQALDNVLGNAIKFSPRGSTIRARTLTEGANAVVEVSDDGPGIPADERAHVFERFYRGGDANRAGEGSGLGLAIAKAIMDAHQGTISVADGPAPDEAGPAAGTTIRLTLPHAQAASAAGARQPRSPAAKA